LRLNLEEKTFQLDRCTFLTRPLDRSSILSCIPSGRLRKAANGIKRHRLHVGLSGNIDPILGLVQFGVAILATTGVRTISNTGNADWAFCRWRCSSSCASPRLSVGSFCEGRS